MGTVTSKGIPVPLGNEGNNVPQDLLKFAQRLDDILSPHTYAEISALGGVDLWDGRTLYQSDTGALRPFAGLYAYKASTGGWQILISRGSAAWAPTLNFGGIAPTLGTGAEITGRYSKFGTLILGQGVYFTGTAGWSSAGSATVTVDLPTGFPFPLSATPTPVGTASMIDQNGAWSRGRLHAGQTTFSTVAQMVIYKGGGGSSNAPPAQSFAIAGAWSNNQTVFFTILYDTAEA